MTKKALTPAGASPSELNLGAIILAGGAAGIAMWALAIPPDVSFSVAYLLVADQFKMHHRCSSQDCSRRQQEHTQV